MITEHFARRLTQRCPTEHWRDGSEFKAMGQVKGTVETSHTIFFSSWKRKQSRIYAMKAEVSGVEVGNKANQARDHTKKLQR
jgi:hypothetical protein